MSLLLLTPRARRDLVTIAGDVAEDSPSAAEKLIDRFAEISRLLAEQPAIGHRHRDVRREGVLCFAAGSYLVLYRRIAGGIEIVRYVHGRRDLRRMR